MSTHTSLGRSRRQSEDPLRRAPVACDRCRGRKTKCLGVAPYPCLSCERVGAECVYPDIPKRIYVSEKEWNDLQARAETFSPGGTSPKGLFSPPATDEPGNTDDEPWYKDREILILTRSGEHQFVGTASSTYLATQLNPASKGNVAFDVSPLHHADLHLRREQNPILPDLPPFDTAKRWYMAQFAYIGSIFAFIQPKYFEDRLTEVYSRPPDTTSREDCLLYCQILLILAFGQMYALNEWANNDGPPGFSYFQAALKLLPDIHEEGSVLFVEVLGLVAYFMQILNRRDAAFLYVGLAVRMAVSLGLHQEVTSSDMDEIELEHRRRVWWSTYSMDRILCVKSGNPVSIHDEDMDVAWPSPLPTLDSPQDSFAQPRILAHYTQLSRILGRIGEDIYRKRHTSGTTLLTAVQSIMRDLEVWLRDIPTELRLDFQSFHHRISREAVSTFLHYYQCVNMTGRPLLFRVCQKRLRALAEGSADPSTWQDGLSRNVVHVVSNCISAAAAATTVMDAAAKHNLLATYGFMDGEHAFSAALVLVMANVAFPYNDRDAASMETALSVLHGMAARGNEYIRARHALLLNLRCALGRQAGGRSAGTAAASDNTNASTSHEASGSGQETDVNHDGESHVSMEPSTTAPSLQQFHDLSFTLNMEESNDAFWDEFSGDAPIGIGGDWIGAFQHQQENV